MLKLGALIDLRIFTHNLSFHLSLLHHIVIQLTINHPVKRLFFSFYLMQHPPPTLKITTR